jgi:hypothetical protein
MGNQLAIALGHATDKAVVAEETGIDAPNLSQSAKSITLAMLEEQHTNLRRELHDHARIIGEMELLGLRASEQEYGVFISGDLVERGFWSRTSACQAIRSAEGGSVKGISVHPIGKATRANLDIGRRHARYKTGFATLKRLERTMEAIK